MIQKFIHKNNNSKLVLFFAGWGADEHLFSYPAPEGYDFQVCFDYSDLTFDFATLETYDSIRLIAWSMGVWAAATVFSDKIIPWEKKTAINGTMFPKHDQYGIPVAIFEGTLAQFSPTTLAKFRRRMCGNGQTVKEFLACNPYRSLESLHHELDTINRLLDENHREIHFTWNQAIIGASDLIFPLENQRNAWNEVARTNLMEILVCEAAHYDRLLFEHCVCDTLQLFPSCLMNSGTTDR